jgi:hypothetical protein
MSFKGRIFNDTWGARKTASSLMQKPGDLIEHTLRLQNGSEDAADVEYGKEYWPSAPIKVSGDGSFDDASLGPAGGTDPRNWLPNDLILARQITSYDDCWTDEIINSLCQQCFLANYQDATGNECISYLPQSVGSLTTITLADIIGDIGEIEEPQPQDIFVNPIINYAYDQGSEKYIKQLQILNVNKVTFDEDYVLGFVSGDGYAEPLWWKCRQLWLKTRQIEKMPESISNCPWIDTYTGAIWYLNNLIDWMGKKRTSFAVSYVAGRLWYVSKHIKIQFPHQTDDLAIECVIEKITKSKNKNTVQVSVILLDEIQSEFYGSRIQDTYGTTTIERQDTYAETALDWQDKYQ